MPWWKQKKKVLFLFDYACHPLPGTMLIFSVNLAVCVMPSPKTGPITNGVFVYINYTALYLPRLNTQCFLDVLLDNFYGVTFESVA